MKRHGFAVLLGLLVVLPRLNGGPSLDALTRSHPQFPSLALAAAEPFSWGSSLAWIEPTEVDFLPALPRARTARMYGSPVSESSKDSVELSTKSLFDYAHAEIGLMYGRSSGKFDREVEAGYILGTAGNDKFQITAGAAYERSTGRVPRFGR